MIPFDRWFVSAEHLAGHELDPTDAHNAWGQGKHPDEYVTAMNPRCDQCATPGAPPHEPSRRCHYRQRGYEITHCTCRACFG